MPITVVNMIPNSLSAETNRDSEPNITVARDDPRRIAASAFTPDPLASGSGPIFVSTDGGLTWTLLVCLPGGDRTVDVTLRTGQGSRIYAGILRQDNSNMNILRKANFTAAGMMTVLVNRANEDQPWAEATSVLGGAGVGLDRGYVGHNDFNAAGGRTATLETSVDAGTAAAPAGFAARRLEVRTTCNQDGPPIRAAIHPNGTIYAVFFRWTACTTVPYTADVVVVRDDNFATGATPYTALLDPGDGLAGRLVATGLSIPWFANLGTQRIGAQMAIAVDPRNSQIVYIAWADGTAAANYTIRVRRSTDGGATWSGDLRAVSPATNPGLAVTIRGEVGFMYQRLVAGNRWETHLERSSDGFATAPSDLTLADVPDQNGAYAGTNPIGDYANLIAVGKDFYGVFSANNTPATANFPQGVTYQRAADFATTQLQDLMGNAVAVSIDPFFFKVTALAPEDDFYVRDWTDSPTSGDTGLEPSTHPVFYQTSDVWNRRGTLPGAFPNDQPENENAGNGSGNIGDNWAFARIRRNVPAASGSKTVTAHFLVSKLGTGSNYADAGSADPDVAFPDPDPTVVFNAADTGPFLTPAYHWHLNAVSSTHLCLAVEISEPGDPFVPPSVVGSAPGWPTTDLRFLNDNNKAQRNMGLSTTPARGAGLIDTIRYGIVHNAATFPRDVELGFAVDPRALRRLGKPKIQVIGGRNRPLGADGRFVFRDVQPGENRWIGLSFTAPTGRVGETVAAHFTEIVSGEVVNGFGLGARLAPMPRVAWDALDLHRSVFTRAAALLRLGEAGDEAEAALRHLGGESTPPAEYAAVLRGFLRRAAPILRRIARAREAGDPFGVVRALGPLRTRVAGGRVEAASIAHLALLHRLDALLTMLELERGDPADILQNVRWQLALYTTVPELRQVQGSRVLVRRSEKFTAGYSARRFGNRDYPPLISALLDVFRETATSLGRRVPGLARDVAAIDRAGDDLAALQKAHRAFLLKLQQLAP